MDRVNVQTTYPQPVRGLVPDGFTSVSRAKLQTTYPLPDGALTPPGWSVGEWTVPFEDTPLAEKFYEHRDDDMEFIVLVSDWLARRGTGKTTLSIRLTDWMDQTDDGLTAAKTTNSAETFIDAYVNHPKGSGLVFDEAESGVNARDAMTTVNKTINEKVSVGRVGEKYSAWNMPDVGQIDKEMQKLAHIWVLVTRKGRARAYALNYNPFEKQNYPNPLCDITWDPITKDEERLQQVFDSLHDQKWESLRDEEDEFIPVPEHEKKVEQAMTKAERERRDDLIYKLKSRDLLPTKEIANVVELSDERVRQIAKEKAENQTEDA